MSVLLFTQKFFEKKSPQGMTGTDQALPASYEKKYRFIMIREELVTLTGDPSIAALLGQFMYWSQQVTDFSLYLEEEKKSSSKNQPLNHGWFHKSIHELIEETMLNVSVMTLHRYLRFLVERKWIQTRTNPECKWDGRTQYRVNLSKLFREFHEHGYNIPRFAKAHFLEGNEISPSKERPL